jgi:hypothetical protein
MVLTVHCILTPAQFKHEKFNHYFNYWLAIIENQALLVNWTKANSDSLLLKK